MPAGCEPTFAVIRLGNTQHKVCLLFELLYPWEGCTGVAMLVQVLGVFDTPLWMFVETGDALLPVRRAGASRRFVQRFVHERR